MRLVRADRKAAVCEIITGAQERKQNAHVMYLDADKLQQQKTKPGRNRKLRLQWAQDQDD